MTYPIMDRSFFERKTMEHEKVYKIPSNLNSSFQLYGFYTISDFFILFLLFGVGMGATYLRLNIVMGFLPFVIYAVLKIQIENYTVYFWLQAALSFLIFQTPEKREYTLFEEDTPKWK